MSPLQNHLNLLRQKDPDLAARLTRVEDPGPYVVSSSLSGPWSVVRMETEGRSKALHSIYDPENEARRFVKTLPLTRSAQFLVSGFGLGYHVRALVQRIASDADVVIVEPDLRLFKLALSKAPLEAVLQHPGTRFLVGLPVETLGSALSPWWTAFTLNGLTPVRFKPLVDANPHYFAGLDRAVAAGIRETQVSHNTRSALSRSFYKNCLANLDSAVASPGIDLWKNRYKGVPAVVVASGPSLDKNAALLKNLRDRALLITVASALKPLIAAGACPDFVVAIDPDPITVEAFDDPNLPSKLQLVFDPCIPRAILDRFPINRTVMDTSLFLWEFLSRSLGLKGSLGNCFSVAHAAVKFARLLGCHPIILTGQDLAFEGRRRHCLGSGQPGHWREEPDLLRNHREARWWDMSAQAVRTEKDVFGNHAFTTQALESFRALFAGEMKALNGIYNATEGGIPIPGIPNIPLREALNRLPSRWVQEAGAGFPAIENRPAPSPGSLLRAEARRMGQLAGRFQDWVNRFGRGEDRDRHQTAVDAAANLLASLHADAAAMGFLQDLLFENFLDWHRQNYKVRLMTQESPPQAILQAQFDRDKTLMAGLAQGARWLETAFSRLEPTGERSFSATGQAL